MQGDYYRGDLHLQSRAAAAFGYRRPGPKVWIKLDERDVGGFDSTLERTAAPLS